jgi:hypothetical protein
MRNGRTGLLVRRDQKRQHREHQGLCPEVEGKVRQTGKYMSVMEVRL